MILRWSHIAGRIGWFDGKVLERLGALFGGDAMHNLICRCPKTQQPIDLQLYTDCVSLALIWSNPVRFQCPHCVRTMRPKWEQLTLSRSLAAHQAIT